MLNNYPICSLCGAVCSTERPMLNVRPFYEHIKEKNTGLELPPINSIQRGKFYFCFEHAKSFVVAEFFTNKRTYTISL